MILYTEEMLDNKPGDGDVEKCLYILIQFYINIKKGN